MNYYRRFLGDYLRDTVHLTMLQDGAYGRLLDTYYAHEKALPLDLGILYAMVRADTPEECSATDEMLAEFFKKTKCGYANPRADKELKRRTDWRKRQKKHRDRARDCHANVTPPVTPVSPPYPISNIQYPITNTNTKERENHSAAKTAARTRTEYSEEFLIFWAAYPLKRDKFKSSQAWKKNGCEGQLEVVLASLAAWKNLKRWLDMQYVPQPKTWLNGKCFEETPSDASPGKSLTEQAKELEEKLGIGGANGRTRPGILH